MRRAKRKVVDKFLSWRRRRRGFVDGEEINSSQDHEDGSEENDELRTAQLYGTVPVQKENASKPKRPLLSNLFRKSQYDQQDLVTLQKLAENGNIRCQVKLGRLHLSDACENASAKEGLEWLIKASKAQNVEATEVLKDCLTSGLGIDEENRNRVIWCIKTSNKIKKQVSDENLLLLRIRRMRVRRTSSMDDIDALRQAEFYDDGVTGIPLKELALSKKDQNAENESQSQPITDDHRKSLEADDGNDESENKINAGIEMRAAVSDSQDGVDSHAQLSQGNEDCVDTANDSQQSTHKSDGQQFDDSASLPNHANDGDLEKDKNIVHAKSNNKDDSDMPAVPPNSIIDQITPDDEPQSEMQNDSSQDIASNEDSKLARDDAISHINQNGDITADHLSSPKSDDDHNIDKRLSKATDRLKQSGASNSPLTKRNCKKETHFGASSTVTVLKEEASSTAL